MSLMVKSLFIVSYSSRNVLPEISEFFSILPIEDFYLIKINKSIVTVALLGGS